MLLGKRAYELAEKVFEQLSKHFFDWNEVRVSTVTELAEAMRALPDPQVAGSNIKRVLQGVFESSYSFELESLRSKASAKGPSCWKSSEARRLSTSAM